MSKSTPWGPSQSENEEIRGVVFHSTAGHGGFHLSRDRQAIVRRVLPEFTTYAGGPWYEEDQDAAIPVLVFAEEFSDEQVRNAVKTADSSARPFNFGTDMDPKIQHYPQWEHVVHWLNRSDAGLKCRQRAKQFDESVADLWERGSHGTGGDGWWVTMRRVRDGARCECRMDLDTLYSKRYFTLDEIRQYGASV